MDKIYITQFFKSYSHLVFVALFAIICFVYEIKPKVWEDVIKMWIVLSLIINIFAIYQLFARLFDLPFGWLELTNQSLTVRGDLDKEIASQQLALKFRNFYRATSVFSEPSTYAVNNLIMFAMMISPYFQGKPPYIKSKLFNTIAISFSLTGLFLSFALTAVLGIFLILSLIFFLYRNERVFKLILYIALGAAFIFISDSIIQKYTKISVYGLFEKRITSILETDKRTSEAMIGDSFGERVKTAKMSVAIMERNPVMGVGLGLTQYDPRFPYIYIDFSVLAVLAEMGVPAALVFLALYLGIFYNLYLLLKTKIPDKDDTDIKRLIGTGIVFFVIIFQTNFLSANSLMTYNHWFFMGMVLSLISSGNIKKGKNVYEISLIRKPLKQHINEKIAAYNHSLSKR